MAQLYIVQEGRTASGRPCYYLYAAEPAVNKYGKQIEEDEQFSGGFFLSEQDCRDWASDNGHTITDED